MTTKQQKAIENAVENGGNVSKAMKDAGYSPATAKNPKKLTESEAWQQLMDEYLPDQRLLEVNRDGLSATKLATSFTEADQLVPDYAVRAKYLELALKLKRRLGPDTMIQNNVQGDMTLEIT